jgi:hypothetical protein
VVVGDGKKVLVAPDRRVKGAADIDVGAHDAARGDTHWTTRRFRDVASSKTAAARRLVLGCNGWSLRDVEADQHVLVDELLDAVRSQMTKALVDAFEGHCRGVRRLN